MPEVASIFVLWCISTISMSNASSSACAPAGGDREQVTTESSVGAVTSTFAVASRGLGDDRIAFVIHDPVGPTDMAILVSAAKLVPSPHGAPGTGEIVMPSGLRASAWPAPLVDLISAVFRRQGRRATPGILSDKVEPSPWSAPTSSRPCVAAMDFHERAGPHRPPSPSPTSACPPQPFLLQAERLYPAPQGDERARLVWLRRLNIGPLAVVLEIASKDRRATRLTNETHR